MANLTNKHWYRMKLPNGEEQTFQWLEKSGNYASLCFTLRNGKKKDIMLSQVEIVDNGENPFMDDGNIPLWLRLLHSFVNSKWSYFVLIGLGIWIFSAIGNCGGGKTIKTVNDLKGTTWQNTSSYNSTELWYKVVIKDNNTYDAWWSNPSEGEWKNYHSGSYKSEENRDGSNGKAIFILTLQASKLPGIQYLIVYKDTNEGRFSANPFIENGYRGINAEQTNKSPW